MMDEKTVRVLVADDERPISISERFSQRTITVLEAATGEEALAVTVVWASGCHHPGSWAA